MTTFHNANDVFRMAVDVEKGGHRFYEAAARRAKDPAMRRIFRQLRDMEADHIRIFKRLRAGLAHPPSNAPKPPKMDPKVRILAERHALTSPLQAEVFADWCATPLEAIRMAIRFENDTILLYTALARWLPEELGGREVHHLVDEEMSHLILLFERSHMSAPDGSLPD